MMAKCIFASEGADRSAKEIPLLCEARYFCRTALGKMASVFDGRFSLGRKPWLLTVLDFFIAIS